MNKFILGLSLILLPFFSYADATDDNEINIDQEGILLFYTLTKSVMVTKWD